MDNHSISWRTITLGLIAFLLLILLIINSQESFYAALEGLNIFLQSVFPALLPFFITSEILTGLGVIDFFSVLLSPIMEPLFKCPGNSSFVWIMSTTSGYPTGARLVGMLRKQNKIQVDEGQRIMSFCSTSGPLFMIGAVAIGMLNDPEAGTIIILSHYFASFLLGLLFRFYKSDNFEKKLARTTGIRYALRAMQKSREKDKRPFGELMGDAVQNSVNTLLLVGGFIILFSVIIDLLLRIHLIDYLASAISLILKPLKINYAIIKAVTGGLFEVTTGCKLISKLNITMYQKISAISFLIGWSGFSIHAQTASLLSNTGIKFNVYLLVKFIHGILATIVSFPLTKLIYPKALQVIKPIISPETQNWKTTFSNSIHLLILSILIIIFLSFVSSIFYKLRSLEENNKI